MPHDYVSLKDVRQHPINRAASFSLQYGAAFFAVVFLLLRWQNDRLDSKQWVHFFDFYSIAEKYAAVVSYPKALSAGLGLAMLIGSFLGMFFGLIVKTDPKISHAVMRNWSKFGKVGFYLGLGAMVALPFLSLRPYDDASPSDRAFASVLGNEIPAAVFVGATYMGYMGIWLVLFTSFRDLVKK